MAAAAQLGVTDDELAAALAEIRAEQLAWQAEQDQEKTLREERQARLYQLFKWAGENCYPRRKAHTEKP